MVASKHFYYSDMKGTVMDFAKKLLVSAAMLTLICLFHSAARADQKQGTKWVAFAGTAEKIGDTYHLKAKNGKGELDAPADAVMVEKGQVKLKTGATVKITRNDAAVSNKAANKKSKNITAADGCRQRQCIGLVLICCDDGRIIGGCLGAFGCS